MLSHQELNPCLHTQSFASRPPVSDDGSFSKGTTCGTGRLGSKISSSANKESPKYAPIISNTYPENPPYTIETNDNLPTPDTDSFPEISALDTDSLLDKISKSTNENCSKLAQRPGSGTRPERLSTANIQAVKQKGSNAYFSEINNGNFPVPDIALPPQNFQHQPAQAQ
ncbi:hypothetical protein DSO57_1034465 [Entomophthora muscae]|uniref:Uncharacterized protein n=1 Tax=Entomophthora muscae TaxID=34485 RepID=A0ACC2UKI3_9FUNG|nr:hypothetical protein DSO57_1034465 [Entomophthora muscae]